MNALRIDADRLAARLEALAGIGTIPGGGVCRLALSQEDRAARPVAARFLTTRAYVRRQFLRRRLVVLTIKTF